jgi:hypothetical protein
LPEGLERGLSIRAVLHGGCRARTSKPPKTAWFRAGRRCSEAASEQARCSYGVRALPRTVIDWRAICSSLVSDTLVYVGWCAAPILHLLWRMEVSQVFRLRGGEIGLPRGRVTPYQWRAARTRERSARIVSRNPSTWTVSVGVKHLFQRRPSPINGRLTHPPSNALKRRQ